MSSHTTSSRREHQMSTSAHQLRFFDYVSRELVAAEFIERKVMQLPLFLRRFGDHKGQTLCLAKLEIAPRLPDNTRPNWRVAFGCPVGHSPCTCMRDVSPWCPVSASSVRVVLMNFDFWLRRPQEEIMLSLTWAVSGNSISTVPLPQGKIPNQLPFRGLLFQVSEVVRCPTTSFPTKALPVVGCVITPGGIFDQTGRFHSIASLAMEKTSDAVVLQVPLLFQHYL